MWQDDFTQSLRGPHYYYYYYIFFNYYYYIENVGWYDMVRSYGKIRKI